MTMIKSPILLSSSVNIRVPGFYEHLISKILESLFFTFEIYPYQEHEFLLCDSYATLIFTLLFREDLIRVHRLKDV